MSYINFNKIATTEQQREEIHRLMTREQIPYSKAYERVVNDEYSREKAIKEGKKSQEWINKKTEYLIQEENKDPDQAYAMANSMAKESALNFKAAEELNMREADEISDEDLEAAGDFYDRLVEKSNKPSNKNKPKER